MSGASPATSTSRRPPSKRDVRRALALRPRSSSATFLPLLTYAKQLFLFKSDLSLPDEAITVDWLMDNLWLVGSPDDVARRIRELHGAVGGFGTVLQLIYDWGDQEECNRRSMALLANEVMPQLADLT